MIAVPAIRRRWGLIIHLGRRRRRLLLLLRGDVAEVILGLVRRGRPGRRRRWRVKRWRRHVAVPRLLRRGLAVRVHRRRLRREGPLRRRVRPVRHRALGLAQTLTPATHQTPLSRLPLPPPPPPPFLLCRSSWKCAGSSSDDPLDLREDQTGRADSEQGRKESVGKNRSLGADVRERERERQK